jgi:hypothetical protein
MKKQLDMAKIAKGLGAKRQTKVHSSGGYFGAMQLSASADAAALPDEFFREEVNDTLGSTIEPWRHAFLKRRDLCKTHQVATM